MSNYSSLSYVAHPLWNNVIYRKNLYQNSKTLFSRIFQPIQIISLKHIKSWNEFIGIYIKTDFSKGSKFMKALK